MAQVTTNTEINTINILQEAESVNNSDLFLLQRGSTTFKLRKSNLNISTTQIDEISDKTVLGNISGISARPTELTILDSSDPDSDLDDALVTEKRIKDYVDTSTQSNSSNTVALASGFVKDTNYQNTSDRKILVSAIIDGGNDIYGFAAHVAELATNLDGKGSGRNSTGRDADTCVVYEYHVSDGGNADATTIVFVVPPNYWFKLTGDAAVYNSSSWEL
jgi:hypothetical protein